MTKQRLHYFDVIKGIAILLVVMGHVMIMGIHQIDRAFLFKLISRIHMPLFFFISGYFCYKTAENGKIIIPNIISKAKQLLIPFFCVSTLWIYYFPHSGIESPLNSTWSGLYCDVWKNGYWFTFTLFELLCIYCVIVPIFNRLKNTIMQIITLIIFCALFYYLSHNINPKISSILSISLMVQYMPIFFIGIIAKKHQVMFNSLLNSNIVITTALILGSVLMYYTCYYWEYPTLPLCLVEYATILVQISVVIVFFSVIKPLCESEFCKEKPSKLLKSFEHFGKESLAIYLLHYFFLFPMTVFRQPLIDMGLGFTPMLIISMVTAITIIAIVLCVKSILCHSKALSLLFLGKN